MSPAQQRQGEIAEAGKDGGPSSSRLIELGRQADDRGHEEHRPIADIAPRHRAASTVKGWSAPSQMTGTREGLDDVVEEAEIDIGEEEPDQRRDHARHEHREIDQKR